MDLVDSAVMPWLVDPATVSNWNAWKAQSWLTMIGDANPLDPTTPIRLVYGHFVNKIATAVGDGYLKLAMKDEGLWAAYLKIQKMEYNRGGFLWLKKDWRPVGKSYYVEVTGGRGWDVGTQAYTSTTNAFRAIERESFNYEW